MATPTIAKVISVSEPESLPQNSHVEPSPDTKDIIDIEHVPVNDDPRQWSYARKTVTLCIVSLATMVSSSAANIQNPSNILIRTDLHATNNQISWTLAAFILVQGNFPLIWSAVAEITGRKVIYLLSSGLFVVGSAVLALSKTIEVMIAMRTIQAAGSSAFLAISAATLADIYDTHERGTMMGVFYAAPLLGPALSPMIGGLLSQAFNWRAIFYFLLICGVIIFLFFLILFKDTYRCERSLTYCSALQRRSASREPVRHPSQSTIAESEFSKNQTHDKDLEKQFQLPVVPEKIPAATPTPEPDNIRLSIRDINPFPPYFQILSRKNNAGFPFYISLTTSLGLVFGFNYCLSYTCERTLANTYGYDALSVGLVLICLGIGSVAGSIIGGRWSDRVVGKMIKENGGQWYAEMRLESSKLTMLWIPLSLIGYGWACDKHLNVAVICVMLVLVGFTTIWMYASTLAYLVDANPGRSAAAVATNSSFRGSLAFLSVLIAAPLQDAWGDGILFTAWACILAAAELLVIIVVHKGESWRKVQNNPNPNPEDGENERKMPSK
ncbi:vacuolar DHA amino acid exporter [Suillus discolor]|uniref:Vacuolar DHA amino acid exporter n=1 Tax=Suillus discolor TaxID=1912936 RepID=A0A9P7JMH2_9AGAM|nr:vacuolar DHA amino acid exporter [Suillus discolor]KAG2089032.1 vacuolar DHA amino acid exporter [Suillus discolor]